MEEKEGQAGVKFVGTPVRKTAGRIGGAKKEDRGIASEGRRKRGECGLRKPKREINHWL